MSTKKVYVLLEHHIEGWDHDAKVHGVYFNREAAKKARIRFIREETNKQNNFGYTSILTKTLKGNYYLIDLEV